MLKKVKIDGFKTFDDFYMYLYDKDGTSKDFNLNLLIGRNGSGKSSFLDALAEIGLSNLKDNDKADKTRFKYVITDNKNKEISNKAEKDGVGVWDKIVRLYTGYTERGFDSNIDSSLISCNANICRFALFVYLASGFYKEDENWKKLTNLIFNDVFSDKNETLKINGFYIEAKAYPSNLKELIDTKMSIGEAEELEESIMSLIRGYFIAPDITIKSSENLKFFWNVQNKAIILDGVQKDPISLLSVFIKNSADKKINYKTGFFYKLNGKDDVFEEQFLSDGENGFLCRYALLYLLSKFEGKALILLDEPETHFNEYWKKYFLYLVEKTLQNTNHDVFIATHSAMLLTDIKNEELHRFENKDGIVKCYDSPINTYGANIIDIGQIMFKMEGNVGERAREDIEKAINGRSIDQIDKKLQEVGPGEYRWRLRARKKHLEEFGTKEIRNVIKKAKKIHKLEHK